MSALINIFVAINAFLIRLTGGRLGGRLGSQTVLLLHTTGRKSGKAYNTPISYYRDGNNYLVVASNWGKESHPAWYFNLKHQPHATIQVGAADIPVEAHDAEGSDYERLWKLVTGLNSQFVQYQKGLTRRIPIVILTPQAA